jgi:hypothetical protein
MLVPAYFINFFQIRMLKIIVLNPNDYPSEGSPYIAILGQMMIIGREDSPI